MWTNADGDAVGVVMNYVFHGGSFWLRDRGSASASPRCAADRAPRWRSPAAGTDIGVSQSVTYKGDVVLHDDAATKAWFYPALAARVRPDDAEQQAAFAAHLDSPNRIVIELVPDGPHRLRRRADVQRQRRRTEPHPGLSGVAASASARCAAPVMMCRRPRGRPATEGGSNGLRSYPTSPAEVTPEWLTGASRAAGAITDATRDERVDHAGGRGHRDARRAVPDRHRVRPPGERRTDVARRQVRHAGRGQPCGGDGVPHVRARGGLLHGGAAADRRGSTEVLRRRGRARQR